MKAEIIDGEDRQVILPNVYTMEENPLEKLKSLTSKINGLDCLIENFQLYPLINQGSWEFSGETTLPCGRREVKLNKLFSYQDIQTAIFLFNSRDPNRDSFWMEHIGFYNGKRGKYGIFTPREARLEHFKMPSSISIRKESGDVQLSCQREYYETTSRDVCSHNAAHHRETYKLHFLANKSRVQSGGKHEILGVKSYANDCSF